ncbi:Uncharacterised protein [Mycobacteroides abscessus subsp. abscessus]|nr:Uncharacterised protein [Mycobacteroides abscessus subsp. abscessus]
MLCGSSTPSPLASTPQRCQVSGMNCSGPTARSCSGSPSSAPPSVSRMTATPGEPSSATPMMGGRTTPSACRSDSRWVPCLLSTLAMPASVVQAMPQPGRERAITAAA